MNSRMRLGLLLILPLVLVLGGCYDPFDGVDLKIVSAKMYERQERGKPFEFTFNRRVPCVRTCYFNITFVTKSGHTIEGGSILGSGTRCATEKCPAACVADLDGTGAVDIGDLLRILTDWGACPK